MALAQVLQALLLLFSFVFAVLGFIEDPTLLAAAALLAATARLLAIMTERERNSSDR
ncbi:hypothetical protein G4Y79_22945 [Phototrophicus methaneseepsis]|uniref:Uncharacterized protein n=1 Tax=Phototrophicus methaneseepsis TaxID=2710758 RepID=A0A7S8E916_9CHLR|nr:hypothetical protein [Phototrophicus methaneseepsis]QPC82508.1 hypothetical protein G4Y79_22945 [Phototrophicus methaneseepsis]